MPTIKSTMDSAEVTRIIGISLPTLYRWLTESRKAIEKGEKPFFPLPIFTGGRKRRLLWNNDSIIAFLHNQKSGTPQHNIHLESDRERTRRYKNAMQNLQAVGVKLPQK